jgi:3-deoxy-D-manno-octulosonic-acid transferase
VIIYQLFIALYAIALRLAAPFVPKARAWLHGRKRWAASLKEKTQEGRWIWMHCASAGEFEQGKPVLEALRKQWPQHKLLVSFFSPSGYEVGVKYKGADAITYLPLDTKKNAQRFVSIVKPELVIFIKYDYWYHHLKAVRDCGSPLLLVSALFRKKQVFFKWYGATYRKLLHFFNWLFVQDEASVELLATLGVSHASANGDTRFDRVATITDAPAPLPVIESFLKNADFVIVAGSTWKEDEELLAGISDDIYLVIAPHEISPENIVRIENLFEGQTVRYSKLKENKLPANPARVLIIDNIGMLSRLYKYGQLAYIGGGFNTSGIHNTLEAAAWGKPIFFGPNYEKFREARGLVEIGAAWPVTNPDALDHLADRFFFDDTKLEQTSAVAANYVRDNIGASSRVINFIQEKRLLTN